MLAIGGASFADIDCHIKYLASYASYEFALSERRGLEVQASHYSVYGHRFIVLHKVHRTDFLVKFLLREALEKVSTGIAKDFWLYYYYAWDGG